MKGFYITASIVYIGFFGLIAIACKEAESAWPIWFLLAMPSLSSNNNDDGKDKP